MLLRLPFLRRFLQNRQQLRGFAFHEIGEGLWSAAARFHDIGAEIRQPLLHRLLAKPLVEGFGKFLDDRLRRAARHQHRVERRYVELGQALLVGSRYIRQHRAALPGGDGQRPDGARPYLAQCSEHRIAFVVDFTRQHCVQHRRRAGDRPPGR